MSEGIGLKDVYRNAMLKGIVEGAMITKICGARRRIDSVTELSVRNQASQTADRLASDASGDGALAYCIASVLYCATIIYGNIGLSFLQKKLAAVGESFSYEEYVCAVATAVFAHHEDKELLVGEVMKAYNGFCGVEHNAARAGIVINEYRFLERFKKGDECDQAFNDGKLFEMSMVTDLMQKAKYGDISEETAVENLNIIYDFLHNNDQLYVEQYSEIYPEVSREKLLVYYICKLGHEEIERVKLLATKQKC